MRRILVAAFVLVPLAELLLIVWLGERIDYLNTIGLLLAVSIIGAVLAKREGLAAWRRFKKAVDAGQIPSDEILDGALVLVAAALLLTPGFITDAVGLTLLVPWARRPVKKGVRRAASGLVDRRVVGYQRARAKRVEVVRVENGDEAKVAKTLPEDSKNSE